MFSYRILLRIFFVTWKRVYLFVQDLLFRASHRPAQGPTLPIEVINQIVNYAVTAVEPEPFLPLDHTSFQPRTRAKPSFDPIRGLSGVSRSVRAEVLVAWFRILIVREPGDWCVADQMGIHKHVLEIRVMAPALIESVATDVLTHFPRLHTAFIDSHNDFVLHTPRDPSNTPQSVGHYRLVATRLPGTLRRLWIVNAHGPDVRVIQSVCAQCPQLQELWIERCTLFSPRLLRSEENDNTQEDNNAIHDSTCHFWHCFPNDHDAYFAAIGVEDYARSLAAELEPLRELKQLHMGLYLTPTEALTAHRVHHQDRRIQEPIWGPVCQLCIDEFGVATREAEEHATAVLAYSMPGLEKVSWSSFYTVNKAGRSVYQVKRQGQGEVICEHQYHDIGYQS